MIRYKNTSETVVRNRINQEKSDWLEKSRTAAQKLKSDKAYSDIGPKWSDIKAAYMDLQHDKCAYCERKLPPSASGRIETDVEHFRPKSRAVKWPPGSQPASNYPYSLGSASAKGYYWLAYEPLNYLTSCKTCNSTRKRDYFPVAKERGPVHGTARQLLNEEKPYLIYPLTTLDDDPEKVIGFKGVVPFVRARSGHRRRRGEVIIDFFQLAVRDDLVRERFLVLDRLINHLENLETGNAQQRDRAKRRIDEITADDAEHASCARSFVSLFNADPRLAYDLYSEAEALVEDLRKL